LRRITTTKQIEAGKDFYEMKNNYGNRWEPLHSIMALGRGGSEHRSWLTVNGSIAPLSYVRGGTPIWCAGLS
jgi:hypothetical protein